MSSSVSPASARASPIKELASSTSPRTMMRASCLEMRPAPSRVVVPSSPPLVETGGLLSSVILCPSLYCAVVESLFVRVRMRFPLSPEGPLGRAASVAARHPSYRIEGENGTSKVTVELELPEEWQSLDDLRTLLKGEKEAEYAADGTAVSGEELFGGLGCFLRKQRRGAPAIEWCTPKKLAGKQLFPCKQIRVYDNDHATTNSWYAFGEMGEDGVFRVDKEGLTERVLSDLGSCARCPILDLDGTAEILARLPEEIDPNRDEAGRYRGSGPLTSRSVAKNNEAAPEETVPPEPKESLFERLAKGVRSSGAGVVAASGAAPGSRNVPPTRYEDVGGMRDTI